MDKILNDILVSREKDNLVEYEQIIQKSFEKSFNNHSKNHSKNRSKIIWILHLLQKSWLSASVVVVIDTGCSGEDNGVTACR